MTFMRKFLDKLKIKDFNEKRDNLQIDNKYFIKSQYSNMPRYYTIDGIKYDIDNPKDIVNIPVFKTTFIMDGQEYGMDSVLRKHSFQLYLKNKAIYNACQEKLQDYADAGVHFQTAEEREREQQYKQAQEQRANEELQKKKLHDSFKIDDMYQFSDIPFEWQWVAQLSHTGDTAWFMLNMNNQYIALSSINYVNSVLEKSKEYTGVKENLYVCTENIDFGYPKHMNMNSLPNTFVECVPYTKTRKISKYPAILWFREYPKKSKYFGVATEYCAVHGNICFMRDGNVGKADLTINDYWIQIRLKGINLVVQRIGKNSASGSADIYRAKI